MRAKFKIGQVLFSRVLGYVRVERIRPNADSYHFHCKDETGNHYFVDDGKGRKSCASDSDTSKETKLHPLTKRESNAAQSRG